MLWVHAMRMADDYEFWAEFKSTFSKLVEHLLR